MKRISSSFLVIFCITTLTFASRIDGKWEAQMDDMGDFELTFVFTVDGQELTGKVISDMGEMSIENGKINGDVFTFDVDFEGNKMPHKCTFKDDDTILMTVDAGQGDIEITLKRIKEE